MTSWVDLASLVAPHAPTLGKMLGSVLPIPGGALVGEWAGGVLARQFGVPPTPEAVANAINTAPPGQVSSALINAEQEAADKWAALAEMAKAEAAAHTAGAQAVNETMRAEVTANISPLHWRHVLGYVVTAWYVVPLPGLAFLFFRQDPAMIAQTATLLSAMSAFILGGSALLGAVAWDTSRFKEAIATGTPRQTVAAAVSKVTGKR